MFETCFGTQPLSEIKSLKIDHLSHFSVSFAEFNFAILHTNQVFAINKNRSVDRVFFTIFQCQVCKISIFQDLTNFSIFRFARAQFLNVLTLLF